MTQDQLKELEALNDRWANGSGRVADAAPFEVMDLLPDVLAHIKELSLDRNGCEYAMIELRRRCGLDTTKIDLMEVWEHIKQLTTERDAALKAYAEMREWIVGVAAAHDGYCAECNCVEHLDNCSVPRLLSTDCGRGYVPKSELDAANAKCAEMEKALIEIRDVPTVNSRVCLVAANALERTDCGKGYHHDDEWKPVIMVLKDIATDDLDRVSGGVKQSAQQALSIAEKLMKGQ